jgi:hypothetical protein
MLRFVVTGEGDTGRFGYAVDVDDDEVVVVDGDAADDEDDVGSTAPIARN